MPTEIVSLRAFTNEEIRDAVSHDSLIAGLVRYKYRKVWVLSTLDEVATIQIRHAPTNAITYAENVGGAFEVAALTGNESRWLEPLTCGWEPFVYVTAQCAIAPAAGSLNVYIYGTGRI